MVDMTTSAAIILTAIVVVVLSAVALLAQQKKHNHQTIMQYRQHDFERSLTRDHADDTDRRQRQDHANRLELDRQSRLPLPDALTRPYEDPANPTLHN